MTDFKAYRGQFDLPHMPLAEGCLALRLDKIASGRVCTVMEKHTSSKWWNIGGGAGTLRIVSRESELLRIDGYKERKFPDQRGG